MEDKKLFSLIKKEEKRQKETLDLIASENHSSKKLRSILGSKLTDKYTEGYPKKRYYAGTDFYDEIENLAIERAKKLFNVAYVNVQPYSGSPANHAVYFATCKPKDKTMGLSLSHGGHLTHGAKVNFSAKYYNPILYGVDKKTNLIDYKELEKLAKKHKPKLIWFGTTSYPRIPNWKKIKEISDSVGAYFVADIAHIAGLVAGGAHPSPASCADIITTTTHKTLRGPRGGMIMITNKGVKKDPDLPQKIDKAIFPGLQGGPHQNQIAGTAFCLKEASFANFKKYTKQIVRNSKTLAKELKKEGFDLVTNGTDNHLILIDLRNNNILGDESQKTLESSGIITNKNAIPFDTNPPTKPSGLRLGTPAVTTRGMKEKEMKIIANLIKRVLIERQPVNKIKSEVKSLCKKFDL